MSEQIAVDLAALAREGGARQPAWTHACEDLNLNLFVLPAGGGVAAHTNDEVDVLLVGVAGDGVVIVEELPHPLGAGRAVVVPKGARRAIQAGGDGVAYLSCHRRRGGLWPRNVPRPGGDRSQ